MYWLIKTEHGYILEDEDGNFVQWFDMACNSKAYCMEQGITPIYLNKGSKLQIQKSYEFTTGKTLWWNQYEVYDKSGVVHHNHVRQHIHNQV